MQVPAAASASSPDIDLSGATSDDVIDAKFARVRAYVLDALCEFARAEDDALVASVRRERFRVFDGAGARTLVSLHDERVGRACVERAATLADTLVPRIEVVAPWVEAVAATNSVADYVEAQVALATNEALVMCAARDTAVWLAQRSAALCALVTTPARPPPHYALRSAM